MNCDELRDRMLSFPSRYLENFDYVWKWKVSVEDEVKSMLDEKHRDEAFKRLVKILPKWQTYRNSENSSPYMTLKESLQNISGIYNEIRNYSLLEFDEIPIESLQKIWHELGRVKEFDGRTNTNGIYYAIAACKPLLLIWGQTMAFDTKVRANFPRNYGVSKFDFRMPFKQWYNVMMMISSDLKKRSECIDIIVEMSHERYGDDKLVPYGRYLDIYYWKGKSRVHGNNKTEFDYRNVHKLEKNQSENNLGNFLEEIVYKINEQSIMKFEVNETSGYFSIQVVGRKRYKNVMCFVKNESVLSISAYANIKESLFENPQYNKLTQLPFPPQNLQLRKESWGLYPYHVKYDLKEDKDVIFQLCKKSCEQFRR